MEQIKGDLFSFSRGYGFNVARGLTLDLTPDHLLEPHTTRRVLEYSLVDIAFNSHRLKKV
jgi:hypothetical protein